jgi:hypothetical protein
MWANFEAQAAAHNRMLEEVLGKNTSTSKFLHIIY